MVAFYFQHGYGSGEFSSRGDCHIPINHDIVDHERESIAGHGVVDGDVSQVSSIVSFGDDGFIFIYDVIGPECEVVGSFFDLKLDRDFGAGFVEQEFVGIGELTLLVEDVHSEAEPESIGQRRSNFRDGFDRLVDAVQPYGYGTQFGLRIVGF